MRTKKALINYLSEVIPQFIILILGFFKVKVFLVNLGEETLGIFQLFTQLLFYLSLLDGGAGSIIGYYLYKPIHDGNNRSIGSILSATIKFFTYIAAAVLVLGVVLDLNIMVFIKSTTLEPTLIKFMFGLILIANVLSYFYVPYTIFMEAKQERYIYNIYFQPILIIKSILEIFLVMYFKNLFVVLIAQLIITVIQNIIVRLIFKKRYKDISLKNKPDFGFIKKIKTVIPHKIGGVIANNVDILIVSRFIGVTQIVVYTSYYYITEVIQKFVDMIAGAVIPGIGNVLVSDENKAYDLFKEYNEFLFYIATVLCVPLFMSISLFVGIWYGENLVIGDATVFMFVTLLFYRIIRNALGTFIAARGLFKETIKCVYLEAGINLVLSLILVHFLGIFGILLATLIAFITSEYLIKPRILNKAIFKRKKLGYYKSSITSFIVYGILLSLFYFIVPLFNLNINNLLTWFVYSLVIFILNLIVTTLIYKVIGELKFLNRFIDMIKEKFHAKN